MKSLAPSVKKFRGSVRTIASAIITVVILSSIKLSNNFVIYFSAFNKFGHIVIDRILEFIHVYYSTTRMSMADMWQ